MPGPGSRTDATTSTPTATSSTTSGWAISARMRASTPTGSRSNTCRSSSPAVAAMSSARLSSRSSQMCGSSWASRVPSASYRAIASVAVRVRSGPSASCADSVVRPRRNGRAARDAVFSVECTARSVGVATTRRVRSSTAIIAIAAMTSTAISTATPSDIRHRPQRRLGGVGTSHATILASMRAVCGRNECLR